MKTNKFVMYLFCVWDDIASVKVCKQGQIFRRRGRQPSRGAPTYGFAKFCERLHEIENILGRGGARAGGGLP